MKNSTNPSALLLLALLVILLSAALLGMPLATMAAVTSMVIAIGYGPTFLRGPGQDGPG